MNLKKCAVSTSGSARRLSLGVVLLSSAVALSACGGKHKDKPASQTAAKVNSEEITVHQINFVLAQQRAQAPDQAASAGREVLERLIDRELALQKAQELKLDRDPKVVQQLEAARREIVARAYAEKISGGAVKPTADEIKAYFDAHPALFKDRKVYKLQEILVEAKPDEIPKLRDRLSASKNATDFVEFLKASGGKFATKQTMRAAEQISLTSLDSVAALADGQGMLTAMPGGAQVLIVLESRSQPVDQQRAAPAIEQFLYNERKRKVVEDDLKGLRASSKIEYVGDYRKDAAIGAAAGALTPSALEPSLAPSASMPASATSDSAATQEPMASEPSTTSLEKGIKGLK